MLPLAWLRPILPLKKELVVKEEILPSFEDLQLKTWKTLYPEKVDDKTGTSSFPFEDKSPKGSVDAPIHHLVDLINHHSSISTLSSCSGRISIFNPNAIVQQAQETPPVNLEPDHAPFTEASGKGRGTWVFVSHDLVDPELIIQAIYSDGDQNHPTLGDVQPFTLRFEPMLLHIAARSLPVGQALLQLALECGFRESGLIVTEKRVTIAIRSHSLALCVPFLPPSSFPSSPFCLTPDYVRAITQECNQRLNQNWNHLNRLYHAIETKWFQVGVQPTVRILNQLPSLRLWQSTAVAIPQVKDECDCSSIYTFGGYGLGPDPNATSSKRTSSIYQLQLGLKGQHSNPASGSVSPWVPVRLNPSTSVDPCWCNLPGITPLLEFPMASQGMAAARLGNWIVLWGGRTSPTQSLDKLYLFHPATHQLASLEPTVLDEAPMARWGHSLVSISSNRLVLVGGGVCDPTNHSSLENTETLPYSFDDIFILHYLETKGFVWEKVSGVRLPVGTMYATTTVVPQSIPEGTTGRESNVTSELLLVAGGLYANRAQSNPLTLFSESQNPGDGSSVWSCRIGATTREDRVDGTITHLRTNVTTGSRSEMVMASSMVGATLSTLWQGRIAILSGGVGTMEMETSSLSPSGGALRAYLLHMEKTPPNLIPLQLSYIGELPDPSSLVHHCCIPLSDSEFVLIGGGVSSFAFGAIFASSYHLELVPIGDVPDYNEHTLLLPSKEGESTEKTTGSWITTRVTLPVASPAKATPVLYVTPQDAKRVKAKLVERGWLDKGVRMVTVENEHGKVIAIPLLQGVWQDDGQAPDDDWQDAVLGTGYEDNLPLSSGRFASLGKK